MLQLKSFSSLLEPVSGLYFLNPVKNDSFHFSHRENHSNHMLCSLFTSHKSKHKTIVR